MRSFFKRRVRFSPIKLCLGAANPAGPPGSPEGPPVQFSKIKNLTGSENYNDLFVIQENGEITGEITNDDLLGNIFANFCIGK